MLTRAPYFLRAVEAVGKWDACDLATDSPAASEQVYAYRLKEKPGMCHIYRGAKGSGWYPVSTYLLIDPQPTESEMRSDSAWGAWCETQPTEKWFSEQFTSKFPVS